VVYKAAEAPSLSLAGGGGGHCDHPARKLTRDPDVREHCLLAVLDTADLREVGIQSQVKKAAEEGEDTHGNAIVAGVAIAVENAVLLTLVQAVHVPFIDNGAEHHDGEHLAGRETGDTSGTSSTKEQSSAGDRHPSQAPLCSAKLPSRCLAWAGATGNLLGRWSHFISVD